MKNKTELTDKTANSDKVVLAAVRDYRCPNCKTFHNDDEDGYWRNKIKYPIISNERKGSTMDGNYHDWTEYHKCNNCETEYTFSNGAY